MKFVVDDKKATLSELLYAIRRTFANRAKYQNEEHVRCALRHFVREYREVYNYAEKND